MRQLMWLLLIGLLGAAIQLLVSLKPTAGPAPVAAMPSKGVVEYKVGAIDPRFGLSEADVLRLCAEAGRMWRLGLGKEVVRYNPSAKLTVNLTYDERQMHSDYASQQQAQINRQADTATSQRSQLDAMKAALLERQQEHSAAVEAYQQTMHTYNAKVAEINAAGGASPALGEALQAEQRAHELSRNALNNQMTAINQDIARLDAKVKEFKALAIQVNSMVDDYNSKHAARRNFEKGNYKRNSHKQQITIYQFNNQVDLRIALAHEFGHAMGLEHTGEQTAIMYPVLAAQNMAATEVTPADVNYYHSSIGAH